jgi:hypothetical protein
MAADLKLVSCAVRKESVLQNFVVFTRGPPWQFHVIYFTSGEISGSQADDS